MSRFGLLARALLALGLGALGCQSLIDLEPRHLGDEPWCASYCDVIDAKCNGTNKVYSSPQACLAVCRLLPPGEVNEPAQSNSVSCRDTLIEGSNEPNVDCALSGPGGGGECGSDCEGYCTILIAACPNVPTHDLGECVRQCGALKRSSGGFNTVGYTHGDSLQCRLFYASEATLDPSNCKHALIAPPDPDALCTEPPTNEPTCADYCRVTMSACTGQDALYETSAQCLAACSALPLGTNADSGGIVDESTPKNTIGCRKFHAYSALARPSTHCHHAGPTGDGYCGDEDEAICESFCLLAKHACGAAYSARFADDSACESECRLLPGVTEEEAEEDGLEFALPTAKNGGDNALCRTLHALRVLDRTSAADAECPIVLGMQACPAEAP